MSNYQQPSAVSAPNTVGLFAPTPRILVPDTSVYIPERDIHDPIRANRQRRDFNHRNKNTYRLPEKRITSAIGPRKEDHDVALFASEETQQKDQEETREALHNALAAKAAQEKKDASLAQTAGHARTGSGSSVSTMTSTSSSVDPGPSQVSDPGQPKTSNPGFPPGKGPAKRQPIGHIGIPS
jgi:hypothetical protein